jgi:hypothetical protein
MNGAWWPVSWTAEDAVPGYGVFSYDLDGVLSDVGLEMSPGVHYRLLLARDGGEDKSKIIGPYASVAFTYTGSYIEPTPQPTVAPPTDTPQPSQAQEGSDNGFLHICAYNHYDTQTNRCLQDESSMQFMDDTAVFGWPNTESILVDVQIQDGTGRWVTQGPGHGEVDSGDSTTQGDNKVEDLLGSQDVMWASVKGPIRFVAYDFSGHRKGAFTLMLSNG